MKKFKLLPILFSATAVGTIGTFVLPLTSCNKNKKSVTKEEWQKAILNICDTTSERNFTMNCESKTSSSRDLPREYRRVLMNYKVKDFTTQIGSEMFIKYIYEEEETPYDKVNLFDTKYSDVFWEVNVEAGEYQKVVLTTGAQIEAAGDFIVQLGLLYDWYDVFSYDAKSNEYKLNFYDYDNIKEYYTIKFDDDKNISYFSASGWSKSLTGVERKTEIVMKFSDYGNSTTSFDETKFKAKLAENIKNIDASDSAPTSTHKVEQNTDFIYHIKYNSTSTNTWKYLIANFSTNNSRIIVFKNGKELVIGTDYYYVRESQKLTMAFVDPIKPNDELYVSIMSTNQKDSASTTLTNNL